MNTKMKRILYFDAMVDEACGRAFFNGVESALQSSESASNFELIPLNFNYGVRRFSPRLMDELIHEYEAHAIILSGSEKNTSETTNAWVQDYLYGLGRVVDKFPDLPILGICFGHQALACLFGGETAQFKYRTGFEQIKASHQAFHHPVFKNFAPNFRMGVTHGDQVVRIPRGFHLLATSDYCDCQALAHDTRPILSVQAHPEITSQILEVESEKEDWKQYSTKDFGQHDGRRFLHETFQWMNAITR